MMRLWIYDFVYTRSYGKKYHPLKKKMWCSLCEEKYHNSMFKHMHSYINLFVGRRRAWRAVEIFHFLYFSNVNLILNFFLKRYVLDMFVCASSPEIIKGLDYYKFNATLLIKLMSKKHSFQEEKKITLNTLSFPSYFFG